MHDLVLRNGIVVDGTGAPRFTADVAIDGGLITEVGVVADCGRREIDATGLLVTPGFVDIHTHYDGQATWDSELAPSSWHGVTSVVMGNCGVGFAPAAPDKHDLLIALMEGVEDIPETALSEGLPWNWESLPEYFDALAARSFAVDIGAQVPHAPLRVYVMGERGGNHEIDPTPEEIAEMARLTKEALLAGAMGFATSRTLNHRSRTGESIGTLTASTEELLGIGQGIREAGRGVIQMISDFVDADYELGLMRRMVEESGRPLSMTLLQTDAMPDRWREVLEYVEGAAREGVDLKVQVCGRPPGILMGLEATLNPFMATDTYRSLAELPLAERVARMRQPAVREAIIREYNSVAGPMARLRRPDKMFPLGDPPEYEPDPSRSFAAEAARRGTDAASLIYDALLEQDGHALIFFPSANYSGFDLEPSRRMVASDRSLLGLSDGGAHVGLICDASFPTYNITHWSRDRVRGGRFSLEFMIKGQTSDTARHVGWFDRGVIAPGYKADVNVIDYDALKLLPPRMAHDLPAGGKRLLQAAEGYRFTIQSGQVTFENGAHTGALPGRLVRGPQAAPAAGAAKTAVTA
jgi:N-acyl-D-aspartate/D-glutamate deacylase